MNIRQRIMACMKELQGVELVQAQGLKFKIIKHDDVTSALRPLYIKHGIVQEVTVLDSRQLEGGTTELHVGIRWVNVDKPEDFMAVTSVGHSTSHPRKDTGLMVRDDLGVGKALSYAVKMAQLKNFALLSGEEDLEQEQAKPAPKFATDQEVEQALQALAGVRTPEDFRRVAEKVAALTCSEEHKKILGPAWLAAKKLSETPAAEQSAPLPKELNGEPREQSTAEKVMGVPGEGLTAGEMQQWMERYKNIRDRKAFAEARVAVSTEKIRERATKAQWAILAECDQSADRLLKMQQEAAQ